LDEAWEAGTYSAFPLEEDSSLEVGDRAVVAWVVKKLWDEMEVVLLKELVDLEEGLF